jgi:competence protein ComEC
MNQTLRELPFLWFLLPFILGMTFQHGTGLWWVAFCALGVSLLFFIFYFVWRYYSCCRLFFVMCVIFFGFSAGILLMHQAFAETEWERGEEEISCTGTLMEYPAEKEKTAMCRIQLSLGRRVIVYLPKDSLSLSLIPGDDLHFRCRFTPLGKSAENVDFDYTWYLKKQGYAAIGFVRKGQWAYVSHTSSLRYTALQYRNRLIAVMKTLGLSDRAFSLNIAITFGYRQLMDEDVSRSFASAGIAHLVAVSGMHVQLFYGVLYAAVIFMGSGRRYKTACYLLILSAIWMFAFVAGLAPSLVRATVMISLYGLGKMLSKESNTLNIIFVSAGLMLVYNPLYLFDIGFQLSYAAVIAIVVIYPMIKSLYEVENPEVSYLWNALCVSMAAQLGTMPLCLYYFHQLPMYFWIANMVIVPLSGPLLVGTLASVGVQSLVVLPAWVYCPLEWILQLSMITAKAIEDLPFSVRYGFYPDEVQTVLWYAILLSVIAYFKNRREVRYIYLFQFFVLLQVIYYL